MLILALEASTTSAKTLLFDTETGWIEVRERRFVVGGTDPSVRDGDAIYTQLMTLGRESATGRGVDLIVLSGTWHGLTLRTPDLSAVTPVMEWSYTGPRDVSARLRDDPALPRWFYERTGCIVHSTYPVFKLMHLAEQGTDVADRLALDQPSSIFARMTGEVWMNHSLASGTGLMNARTMSWDAEVIARFGLEEVILPELRDPTDTAPLNTEAAALLGLRSGIAVVNPSPDGGLDQVGARATQPGDMTFSMGTSGALRMATPHPAFSPTMGTFAYRSPLGPLSGAATSGCGNCVDWARERFFGTATPYSEIEPMLSADKRDLPVFLPFLFGERSPGWHDQRRGGLLGLGPHHSRADIYQSVLEGIVFSLYHCFTELTELNGPPQRIVLSGGVLSSPFWSQLTTDVFGVPMEASAQPHSSVVGALRMGLKVSGLGMRHPVLDDVAPRILEPRAERRAQYDEAFARYREQYVRTAPVSPYGGETLR